MKFNLIYVNGQVTISGKDFFLTKKDVSIEDFNEIYEENEREALTVQDLNRFFLISREKAEEYREYSHKKDNLQKLIQLGFDEINVRDE